MDQSLRQKYILAIERLLRRSSEIPLLRREVAEMIVDQVVSVAIEDEAQVWIMLSYGSGPDRPQ